MGFVWGTIIVILSIFALFFYGAHRADQAVAAKAAAKLQAQAKAATKTTKK